RVLFRSEGLVQVQVRDVRAELARAGEPDHGIHVRAVQVDLTAGGVDALADIGDGQFEHAVRGRVGDHQGRQTVAHLVDATLQIVDIHIAVFVGSHHHDVHARSEE